MNRTGEIKSALTPYLPGPDGPVKGPDTDQGTGGGGGTEEQGGEILDLYRGGLA
jgi:hypothetical protein